MAKNNEEQKKTTDTKQKPERIHHPQSATNLRVMTAGVFMVALGALVLAGYTLSCNRHLHNALTDQHNQLSSAIDKLAQKQDKVDAQIEAKTQQLEETKSALQAQFDALNKQVRTAMSQQLYQNQNWLLLKARYYMELAQINAHWSKSFDATASLLQEADRLLQQLNEPEIFAIRQAIAQDIAKLNAMPKIDIAGILSQLDAAQNSLNALNIISILNNTKPLVQENEETNSKTLPVWRLRLQDSISLLNKLVVIRHNDEQVQPLISPAMEALLKENIHLNLQEAQWAVLNGNTDVYRLALNQAIATLKKNFNEHAQNTAALIKQLTELHQMQLTPKHPDIGSALPLLNQLIEAKESATTKPANTVQEGGA